MGTNPGTHYRSTCLSRVTTLLLLCLFCSHGSASKLRSYNGDLVKHERAAKLYFMMRGDFNKATDIECVDSQKRCKFECPLEVEGGCIAASKLKTFLGGRWIPARGAIKADTDKGHTTDSATNGHYFHSNAKNENAYEMDLADWVAYVTGRPKAAVPEMVRKLLQESDATLWPRDILPDSSFRPPENNGYEYVERDNEEFVLHKNNTMGIDALIAAGGYVPYFPEDHVGIIAAEEGQLMRNKFFQGMFSWAMVLMGLALPLIFLIFVLRFLPPDAQIPGLKEIYSNMTINGPTGSDETRGALGKLHLEAYSKTSHFIAKVQAMMFGGSKKHLYHPTKIAPNKRDGIDSYFDRDVLHTPQNPHVGAVPALERIRQLETENQRIKGAEEEERRANRLAQLSLENERLKLLKNKQKNFAMGYSVNV